MSYAKVVCEVDGVPSEPKLTGLSVEPLTLRLREDGIPAKIRNTGELCNNHFAQRISIFD